MSYMFNAVFSFNLNIGNWITLNVTDMRSMFNNAKVFNENIGNWITLNVTDMTSMFKNAKVFNKNIGNWDVSNVTDMNSMFNGAKDFNQNIKTTEIKETNTQTGKENTYTAWDVSNVTDMNSMFNGASSFNQNISDWYILNVNDMTSMFEGASKFNQDLTFWCVTNIKSQPDGFKINSNLSDENEPIWGTCPEYLNDIPNIENSKKIIKINTNYIIEDTQFIIKKEGNTRSIENFKLLQKSIVNTICTQFRIFYKSYGIINNSLPDKTNYLAEIVTNYNNNTIFKISQLDYNVYGNFELYVDYEGKIYTRFIINYNNFYVLVSVYININNNNDFRILFNNSPFLNNNEPIKVRNKDFEYKDTPLLNNGQYEFYDMYSLEKKKTHYFFDNRLKINYSERIIEFDTFSVNGNKIQLKDSNNGILNIELFKNKYEMSRELNTITKSEYEIELYKNEYSNTYIRWEKDNYIIKDIFNAYDLKSTIHKINIKNSFLDENDLSEIKYYKDLLSNNFNFRSNTEYRINKYIENGNNKFLNNYRPNIININNEKYLPIANKYFRIYNLDNNIDLTNIDQFKHLISIKLRF